MIGDQEGYEDVNMVFSVGACGRNWPQAPGGFLVPGWYALDETGDLLNVSFRPYTSKSVAEDALSRYCLYLNTGTIPESAYSATADEVLRMSGVPADIGWVDADVDIDAASGLGWIPPYFGAGAEMFRGKVGDDAKVEAEKKAEAAARAKESQGPTAEELKAKNIDFSSITKSVAGG